VARAARRWGPRPVFNAGMVLIVAGFVGLGSAPNLVVAGASLLSLGMGFGLSFPLVQDFVTSAVPGAFRGAAVGAFVMSVRIGQAVGPLLGSLAAENPGTRVSYAAGAAVTLVFLLMWQPARALVRRATHE